MRRIRRFAARLLAVFLSASPEARTAGDEWYSKARRIARRMARNHCTTMATAAGVIAALSPRLGWTYNVLAADLVLSGASKVPGVFKASLAKARAIAAGARPLLVLKGPKVRAFYRALCGDEDATVVDVWTARAAGLSGDALSAREYHEVSRALTMAAVEAGVPAARLQAVAWVQVRGRA